MPLKDHENILVFYDKLPTYNPQMKVGLPYKSHRKNNDSSSYGDYNVVDTNNKGERYPTTIIKFYRDTSVQFFRDANGIHPTQKPLELIRYLVRTYSNEGDTVLDNCMGSGTTAVACIKENRIFIGFELNEDYFNSAEERIEKARREVEVELEADKHKLF